MWSSSSLTGRLFRASLIAIPRLGWINVHGSLLPKYRGAAPINWAIINGETRTGVTTMQIDAGLDTGPMLLKYETANRRRMRLLRSWRRVWRKRARR